MEYKKRIADQILTDKLDSSGAVLVEGSKEIRRVGDANGHSRLSAYRLAERSAIISESLLNIEIFAEYNFDNCLNISTFAKTNYRLLQWKRL